MRKRVLIVDDDPIALIAIGDLLREAEFDVEALQSPIGAADIAEADSSIAAVVLDLNMPIMRGDNVARLFLSRTNVRDIPLLLISGDAPDVLKRVHRNMPTVEVLSKVDMASTLGRAVRSVVTQRPRQSRRVSRAPEAGTGSARPRVLIADDYDGMRLLIEATLRKHAVIVQASSAQEAALRAKDEPFSAILLDIDTGPGMTGIAAAQEIRRDGANTLTPIVFLSGMAPSSKQLWSIGGPPCRVLLEPFKPFALLNVLNLQAPKLTA